MSSSHRMAAEAQQQAPRIRASVGAASIPVVVITFASVLIIALTVLYCSSWRVQASIVVASVAALIVFVLFRTTWYQRASMLLFLTLAAVHIKFDIVFKIEVDNPSASGISMKSATLEQCSAEPSRIAAEHVSAEHHPAASTTVHIQLDDVPTIVQVLLVVAACIIFLAGERKRHS